MNTRYNLFQKTLSVLLSLVLVLGLLPTITAPANAVASTGRLNIVGNKISDPATLNEWEKYFGANKLDTEFAGAVWTDKSVFTDVNAALPGVTLKNPNNFLIALSAIAANTTITGHTTAPTDTMLVLDVSGSMVDGTYEVGYIRRNNNNYQEVSGIDMSLINAMIDATNSTIDTLMTQNPNNRVGVVLCSGNTSTGAAATPATATVVLPLGRYTGVDKQYLSVDATYTTSQLYEYVSTGFGGGSWQSAGQSDPYVASDSSVSVSVKNGLTAEGGAAVTDSSKQVDGGTYIQNGLYKALGQFLAVEDTVVPEGKAQAGAERMPVLVLMSDGAPTIATTDYTNIGDSNTGDGSSTNDRITMLTQLTAAYVKGAVADHYKETPNDKQDVLFMTLGLGTSSNAAATAMLYPAGSSNDLTGYWNTYLRATAGNNVTVISGNNSLTVRRNALVAAMDYVGEGNYHYADDADALIASFEKMVSQIQLQAKSYNTLVSSIGADMSGYVTFEDELGELMEVAAMKGILMADGNGGSVLYTGKGMANSMNTGTLGTPEAPNARGDEFIATVKERIAGLTTTTAQQLVNAAYNDQQLYYQDDNNWSNYIGWYAKADGSFAGFWDKDSGYENAPADAVYANKSYGYLGVEGDSDMMHVVVLVRTNLKTRHQTVLFKIPAALLPTVTYHVTLDEDDPTAVKEFTREGALPMRLVFEVGPRADLNCVNLEQKIAQHVANGGHVHDNADGTYTFYTNSWAIGNDLNNNGVPDPDEVDTAVVTESHFHPALDNSRFYFTDDTLVLDANGNPVTTATKPSGTNYHHTRYIYNATTRTAINMPLSETTLAKAQKNDAGQWYIPAGSAYLEWNRFKSLKGGDSNADGIADNNATGTLDYYFLPAAFHDSAEGMDMYTFLGNNGAITVAPATGIALTKKLGGEIADNTFTFTITLSGIPAGQQATPVVTDANGDPISGVTTTALANNSFDLTMPAGITAYITGIPVGTSVTVKENIAGDYFVSEITVDGAPQVVSESVQVTVPALTANKRILPVTFTNTPNGYGDLVIEKEVHHNLATSPDALAAKVFAFQVALSGDKIQTGDTFQTSAGKTVVVGANGVVTFEDGAAITLHNDESITIYQLPDGTAYTVTETNIPDGFALSTVNGTTATAATGEIETNGTDLADFVNRYPANYDTVNIPLNLTVNKVLNGTPPTTEVFRFTLEQLVDGSYVTVDDTLQIASDAANKTVSKQIPVSFNQIGTYHYRLTEIPGATPGMTYSTTRALFAVIVTDNDMDGRLEVAVREEANIQAQYDDATGITVTAEFTNVYQVHSTNAAVNVHKNLVNNTGVEIPLTEFRFGLFAVDANGNATGNAIQTVTAGALGDATFNIPIAEHKDLTYIIKELVPDTKRVGTIYDPSEYVLNIAVTADPSGQLSATTSTVLKGKEAEGQKAVVFTNTYTLTPTAVSFAWSKTLSGLTSVAQEKQFRFELYRTDDTYQKLDPAVSADAYTAYYYTDRSSNGTISIDKRWVGGEQVPVIDKVGTYYFKMIETIPNANDAIAGLTYDTSEYHISFTVTDNGNGAMVASTPVIHKVGQAAPVTEAAFVNVYTVTGTQSIVIDGTKDLSGRAPVAGEFTFGLYTDLSAAPIQTATNLANGTFVFEALEFTAAHLDANNASKTYTYYVKEILPAGVDANNSLNGVTYDTTVHTVTVTVSHDGAGKLVVTPSDNHTGKIEINNTYAAEGVTVTLHGNKVLTGDWTAVTDKTFTFELYEADEAFRVTNTTPKTATNDADGNFSFELSFADGDEKIYYFVLREDTSAQAGGVDYDSTIYRITVNVSDPGNGKLTASVHMYHPGTGNVAVDPTLNAPVAVFNNRYSVASAQVTLAGQKELSGRDQVAEEFDFVVLENNQIVTTGTNNADGTIVFQPITYTKVGTHTYTVVEATGTAGGVTYDTAAFTVTVTVTDNGDGTLTANVSYEKPIVFKNVYDPDAATAQITGSKELSGRDQKAGEFKFQLLDGQTVIRETENTADGKIVFETLTFDKTGTYTYTVKEVKGTATGVTYDEATYTVTVTVTDDGTGKLSAAVAYSDEVVFHNTYKVPDIPVTGDSFNLALCIAVLLISGIATTTLAVLKKKFVM